MNSSRSVVELLVRELTGRDGMLQHNDGLPYDTGRLLTPAGFAYAQAPANLERYWRMHADTFQPAKFQGSWEVADSVGTTTISVPISAGSVTVIEVS
jgi:hypothetical protein